MNRIISFIALTFSLALFISCSGTANLTQGGGEGDSLYPSWYDQQSVVNTDSVIYAYATAIDDDSAAAVSKAVAWAESELQSSVSYSLETIRQDALEELGDNSGLNSSAFTLALKEIDKAVNDLVSTANTEVKTVEGFESYRGFAEVILSKERLVNQIDEQLKNHEKAWKALKESQAFQQF